MIGILSGILSGMIALWFKGAIAAFYLREHPTVGYEGAAYVDDETDGWKPLTVEEYRRSAGS